MSKTSKSIILLSLVFLMLFAMTKANRTIAQNLPEGDNPPIEDVLRFDEEARPFDRDGKNSHFNRMSPEKIQQDIVPNDAGGPDQYGYTWDNTAPYSWVDAKTNGYRLDLSGCWDITDAINIGFEFPFYDQVYSQLYVSSRGYLTFTENQGMPYDIQIPIADELNNLIAPNYSYWCARSQYYNTGDVYFLSAGESPNRYAVIEWNEVSHSYYPDEYTFQVILFEDGNIKFQYKSLLSYYYSTIGIEDSRGAMGLSIPDTYWNIQKVAMYITRPGNARRALITPTYHDYMAEAGQSKLITGLLENIGNLGSDTFTIAAESSWGVELFEHNTTTPLREIINLEQGGMLMFDVQITAPRDAAVHEENQVSLYAWSHNDPSANASAKFNQFIPPAFKLAYVDSWRGKANYVWPYEQKPVQVHEYLSNEWESSILELPNVGHVIVQEGNRYYGDVGKKEIYWQIFDGLGNPISSPNSFSSLGNPGYRQYSEVTLDQNGSVFSISWRDREYYYDQNQNKSYYKYTLWQTIVDFSGNLISPPTIIRALDWTEYQNAFHLYDPKIVAMGDGKFMLIWEESKWTENDSTGELYYVITNPDGSIFKDISAFTGDLDYAFFDSPVPVSLNDGRVFVTFSGNFIDPQYGYYNYKQIFRVVNTNGDVLDTKVVSDDYFYLNGSDGIVLNNGNVVMTYWDGIVIIDPDTLEILAISDYSNFDHPILETSSYQSLLALDDNKVMLVWGESDNDYTYMNMGYIVFDQNADPVTKPYIINSSMGWIRASRGYAITSNTVQPEGQIDLMISSPYETYIAGPGFARELFVEYGNIGLTTAESATITAVLPSGVHYVSDNSGHTPSISGDTITWHFPEKIDPNTYGQFAVVIKLDGNLTVGSVLPVTFDISTTGEDVNPHNNNINLSVYVGRTLLIPLIRK